MHVLVTGGTGFIGTALVQQLLATGHNVTVLSRKPASAQALFQAAFRRCAVPTTCLPMPALMPS